MATLRSRVSPACGTPPVNSRYSARQGVSLPRGFQPSSLLGTAGRLLAAGPAAPGPPGVGHHDTQRIFRVVAAAEEQREIAAAGAAVGQERHVPARLAAQDEQPRMGLADPQRCPIRLVVAIVVDADQPAAVPAAFLAATDLVEARAEQHA